jgi:chromosome segregation ATPase
METMAQIKSQLEQIELQEQANQQEQVQINQRIVELETELKQQQQRRNQLDQEALKLYTQAEELKPRLRKLKRIANLSKEFLELHEECQDNQDLLNTLYSSVSTQSSKDEKKTHHPIESESSQVKPNDEDTKYTITIDEIKEALPNAEKIYQQLVAGYLEEYKTYQNFIVDGLDLIWYAVAFIAFGRNSYRKMSFKYHPDLDGSELAMQLINTAWSISQNFVNDPTTVNDAMNT